MCQKPKKSLRSPDHKLFLSRLGTASDSDSDDGAYTQKASQKRSVGMRQVSMYSPSDSGSDYPAFPPQARCGMADTPSSGLCLFFSNVLLFLGIILSYTFHLCMFRRLK